MKKLEITFILLGFITYCNINAQEKIKEKQSLTYKMEFKFAETESSDLDSVFKVYCVFDERDIINIDRLEINYGINTNKSFAKIIDLTDNKKVTRKTNKLWVEIGESGKETSAIEIIAQYKNGAKHPAYHKP